jgi:hypothetical protein
MKNERFFRAKKASSDLFHPLLVRFFKIPWSL